MKRCCEIREVLVKISFIGATQLLATIGIAFARDDPPPSPVRPWAPSALPRYEGELRQYQPTEAERRYLPAINPRKTYNLAELIDIGPGSQLLPSVSQRALITHTSLRPQLEDTIAPSFRSRSCELT
jgi:hypothetical protein